MYLYAWKCGLKTTYYLRSRPATRIQQATVGAVAAASLATDPAQALADLAVGDPSPSDADGVTCSLETPDTCEACQ
jgi:ribonucleoside-diphosphate reductase alpha chain